ncbi:hypothetical protein ABC255_10210 [Neobacillus sp. 3P2-tot-E-2]|uniref:hypothetical protein n=1 Tax=Neobacillus sp. 3P2-tot-E-2 TaxID=3132212 RepID=UPI0039A24D8D
MGNSMLAGETEEHGEIEVGSLHCGWSDRRAWGKRIWVTPWWLERPKSMEK